MKLDIPKIVRPVDLGDYAEEMRGKLIYVWVNSPVALLQEYFTLQDSIRTGEEEKVLESQAARMREILAELLSQGPQELRWTVDEVGELISTADTDPLLYPWVVNSIFEQIGQHRVRQKKA
jgi:hypothetical protein